ncbi:hypothetical protein AYJ57_06060 [Salipiger sp. CCB-MM3]|uniref:hypothetical protein n=1 Tax=Roseobacteraceae TaxID=2854170 RepID=UPI00080A96E0|nr:MULTISPECIES: hypothetical protein [Roseobacteraceae]ANT59969.1 hypothetical protein AYJ57_06060 [Salipiger sp. CCB-MM3]MCA0997855.1 hypothetical protein [Alloyangia pacifica]
MLSKIGASLLLLAGAAAPLAAAEQEVLMTGLSYFPEDIYVSVGDVVHFVNASEVPMSATASDASWDTGVLQPGEAYALEVTDGMQGAFGDTYTADNTAAGVIDYVNPAPLELENNY